MSQYLQLERVGFAYDDGTPILADINLNIPAGQFVCLLGASGSGKSTLLRLLAGLQFPQYGRLLANGQPIAGPGLDRGVVFQDYALFPWMSVVDNLAIAIGKAAPQQDRRQRRATAVACLQRVGLDSALGLYPFELSGGMRQRAAIARALALRSPVLLMDEPFGALDPANRARLQDVLLATWEEDSPRKTIVFVTHDIDEALYLGDRVVVLGSTPGRIIADYPVPFARHRERRQLFDSPDFHTLRETIAERLAADTLRQIEPA